MAVSDFVDMMKQTVSISPFVSRDQYGVPTYGTAKVVKARIGNDSRIIKSPDGSMITVTASVWLGKALNVTTQDRILLPDGTTPPILKVEQPWDQVDHHHTKLLLG